MSISSDTYIPTSQKSLLDRLTATGLPSGQKLSQTGLVYKETSTKDTGGDGTVAAALEKLNIAASTRLPEQSEKTVEEQVAGDEVKQLSYPSTLPHDFRFDLEMMDYKRPTPGSTAKMERKIFISLPLPRELHDNKGVEYSVDQLGLVGSIADAASIAANGGGAEQVAGTAAPAGVRAAQVGGVAGAGAIASRAGAGLATRSIAGITAAGLVSGEVRNVVSQMVGAQLNPNLSVTFKGPRLREFSFTWIFAPHSAEESKTLREILTELQARSLPSMTQKNSAGILSYPQMCQVTLQPNVYPFKKSVITNLNIDYAPAGAPSFFHGTKEPTVIQVTMQMTEIEYFLSEDYGGATGKGLNDDIGEIAAGLWDQVKELGSEVFGLAQDITGETTDNE